ncbi:MAG: hypothetical protein FWG35_04605, partial [Spirochaetaceae bacterium]|nr:hypothetical protein [Spirochaetaceae bacterium]
TSTGTCPAGGVVGYAVYVVTNDCTVQYCYSTASVTGKSRVGGVVGYFASSSSCLLGNCVALNPSVTTTSVSDNIGRVGGEISYLARRDGFVHDNYARSSGMTLRDSGGTYTPTGTTSVHTEKDGANVDVGTGAAQYNNQGFWNGLAYDFSAGGPWQWGSGNLPILKNMPTGK